MIQWQNQLTDILGIKYPIIGAPMLGVTTPDMVAAVSEIGGLGSLAIGGLSPERCAELIRQTRALTSRPFAVNFFSYDIPQVDRVMAERMQDFLERLCATHHIQFERQPIDAFRFYSHREQVDILLSERTPVVSFTFGIPEDDIIDAFHAKGVILIGTATCLEEAELLDQKGIDIIAAQGIEAGGHRGSFLYDDALPQVGMTSLVSDIVRHAGRPVLAAGGIHDGKTVRVAMALGAQGVQIGTALLASDESTAIPSHKAALKNVMETDVVLTKAFSGRWARGIRNTMMTAIDSGPGYPGIPHTE